MSKYDVAGTLKRLRAKSGMTADAIGQLVGRSGKTVNAWEHGNGQPDAEMLIKLSQIYHVDNMLEEFRSVEPQTSGDPICLSEHERRVPDRQGTGYDDNYDIRRMGEYRNGYKNLRLCHARPPERQQGRQHIFRL